MQAQLGFTSESRCLRYAKEHYRGMFPNLPGQSGYNKRLRLHLVATLLGLPVGNALTGVKADERQVFLDILAGTAPMNRLEADGRRQILIGDKNYYGKDF